MKADHQLSVSAESVADTFGGRPAYIDNPGKRAALDRRMTAFNTLTETEAWQQMLWGPSCWQLYDSISCAIAECPLDLKTGNFNPEIFRDHVLLVRSAIITQMRDRRA